MREQEFYYGRGLYRGIVRDSWGMRVQFFATVEKMKWMEGRLEFVWKVFFNGNGMFEISRSKIEFDRKRSYLLEKFIGYFSFLNLVNNCNKYWNIYREGFRMKWKLVGNFEISIINSCVQCTYIYGSESRNNILHTHDSIVIVIPYLFHSGIKIIELKIKNSKPKNFWHFLQIRRFFDR